MFSIKPSRATMTTGSRLRNKRFYKRISCLIPIIFFLSLYSVMGSQEDGSCRSDEGACPQSSPEVEHPYCRLFIAESTIPNAGLGIFTGVDLKKGDNVAEPDLVVPIPDFEWHAADDMDFHFLWYDYSWQINDVGMGHDMEDGTAIVFGTGCMPNCHFALNNAHEGTPDYDHVGLERGKDVGIGAFTGWYNQRMITTRKIPAGGEIFVDYGEHWFLTRPEEMGTVPLKKNFKMADKFLQKFSQLYNKSSRGANKLDLMEDFWSMVTSIPYVSRSSNALPLSFKDMRAALKIGSARSRLPSSVKTLEWLSEHGRCMDNIRPGNSTIRQAGRGAFATRFIAEGGLVAPGPALHIPNRTSLNMYDIDLQTGQRDEKRHIGMQLILNYCFGHKKSTVLLCPYTSPSAYINHSSKTPNARIVWADNSTPNHNANWLEEDVDFLKKKEIIGLSLNFVATRDIQPDEEVFIDYGPEWEEAWNKHVKEWQPPPGSGTYISPSVYNRDLSTPLRTTKEQEIDPYPENIVFYCHYEYEPGLSEGPWDWSDKYANDTLFPCKIINRVVEQSTDGNDSYFYSVEILSENEMGENIFKFSDYLIPEGEVHRMNGVPRWAIDILDEMYSKNEYLLEAFRHEMMIPDDIFPESWINL